MKQMEKRATMELPVNAARFEVYYMDMYMDEGGWTENERHLLGELTVESALNREIDDIDILAAMARFTYPDFCGCHHKALNTTDRRRVYAEDYSGDGTWWEVGTVKDRMPVYGLRLIEGEGV